MLSIVCFALIYAKLQALSMIIESFRSLPQLKDLHISINNILDERQRHENEAHARTETLFETCLYKLAALRGLRRLHLGFSRNQKRTKWRRYGSNFLLAFCPSFSALSALSTLTHDKITSAHQHLILPVHTICTYTRCVETSILPKVRLEVTAETLVTVRVRRLTNLPASTAGDLSGYGNYIL